MTPTARNLTEMNQIEPVPLADGRCPHQACLQGNGSVALAFVIGEVVAVVGLLAALLSARTVTRAGAGRGFWAGGAARS